MGNKLSHSSTARFQDCSMAYKYHYIDRLRSKTTTGALLFGSAIDAAITSMLKEKDKKPEDVFAYFWRFQEINGVRTYLPTAINIVYSNSDYDEELLNERDIFELKEKLKLDNPIETINEIISKKEIVGFHGLNEIDKITINYANWLVLFHKGLLMIEAVKEKVIPKIQTVLSVQEYVKLENDEGDTIVGYADLVCKHKDYDTPIVFDFKTSSKEYEKDSVLTSPQLTLYVHALSEKYKTRKAGFIVLNKHVKKNKTKSCELCGKDGTGQRHKTCDATIDSKRCNGNWIVKLNPEILVDIIIDDIPERTEEIVLENMNYINQSIHNGVYHRNFSACVKPWGKCPFFNKCYKDNEDDLINMEKKK